MMENLDFSKGLEYEKQPPPLNCSPPVNNSMSDSEDILQFGDMKKRTRAVHRVEKITNRNAPPIRFSFCAIAIGEKYYVWGGRNNRNNFDVVEGPMQIYNFRTQMWDKTEEDAIALTGATPVVWDGKIWVWGGYSKKYHNDMHMYDPATKEWTEVKQHGPKPQRRWHYSVAVHKGKMYMFGGTFDQTHHTDLHVFDFETKTWSPITGLNAPRRPRRRHRQVVWDDKLFIIGGKEDSDTASTMLVYDIKNDEWTEITDNDVDMQRGMHIPSSHDHSLVMNGDEVYLFGASKPHRVMKYYFKQKLWMPVVPKDYLNSFLWEIPTHHGNPAVWNGSVYFFGGRKTNPEQEMTNDLYKFVFEEPKSFCSLADLLTHQREFSNVQFIVHGKKIYADRCILWAKSEYFRKFFSNRFSDSVQNNVQIQIVNCSYRVFYSLIHYLYTNEMWSPDSWDDALSLLQQADKYQILPLKDHCCQILCQMITMNNVSTLWSVADTLHLRKLKDLTLQFIVDRFPIFVDCGKYDELVTARNKNAEGLLKALGRALATNVKSLEVIWRREKARFGRRSSNNGSSSD